MKTRGYGFVLGLLLAVLVMGFRPFPSLDTAQSVVLATTMLMATWWLTEAIPIYATALVPLAVFPLLGVRSAGEVSRNYMDPNIVLFMGGFFLAMAIQKWDLHRRIALSIMVSIGDNSRRIVLGFMVATAFLSMWVNNTASVVMMFPIATAVIAELEDRGSGHESFPVVLLLGVATGEALAVWPP